MNFFKSFASLFKSPAISLAPELSILQQRLDYNFRHPSFLQQALTHPSYVAEHPAEMSSNQRLEFLGDGVMGHLVNDFLFQSFPDEDEGILTQKKSNVVRDEVLAEIARGLCLGDCLRLGVGETRSGGQQRASNLADAFEAIVGAIYLDGGLAAARKFLETQIFSRIEMSFDPDGGKDFKSLLQEYAQQQHKAQPAYRVITQSGPQHEPIFEVEVRIGQNTMGVGQGKSKKIAEKDAAKNALYNLQQNPSLLKLTNP